MESVMHSEEARQTLAQFPFHNLHGARNILRFAALAALVAFSALLVAGCGIFDPKKSGKIPPDIPPEYVIPFQPGNVLVNLEIAYSTRDTAGTKVVYDSSYVGISEDLSDPPGTTPASFTYFDEVAHVASLRRTPGISSVSFELGPETSWTRLESNDPSHPDWAVIQIAGSSLDIQVTEGINTLQAEGSKEFFEFSFKPTTPAPGSPTDTLWKIVKWTETRSP
jgi:hypothetical protein